MKWITDYSKMFPKPIGYECIEYFKDSLPKPIFEMPEHMKAINDFKDSLPKPIFEMPEHMKAINEILESIKSINEIGIGNIKELEESQKSTIKDNELNNIKENQDKIVIEIEKLKNLIEGLQKEPTPSVSEHKKSKIKQIKEGLAFSAKEKVEILRQLGVFENDIMKGLDSNKRKRNELLSKLFGGDDSTNIDRYITDSRKDQKMSITEFREKYNR
jgi:hypothetical protein